MNDIKDFFIKGLERLRVMVEEFISDSLRLLKALGPWAAPFILSYLILGFIPFIFAMNIGGLTDAIIGARGIGAMTVDVSNALRTFVIISLLGFASYTFLSRFEGKAAVLGQTFAEIVALLLLTGFMFDLGWWMTSVLIVLLLPIRIILDKLPYVRYVLVLPAVFLFAKCASTVIEYAVIRAITVGDAMSTVAAAGFLTVIVCILLLRHGSQVERRG
jgi:hypothetical protein